MEYTITTPSQLGHVLHGYRKQRGLTQHELGARVGLTQKAVSMLETDASRTNVERLFRLLSALELQVVLRDKRPQGGEETAPQQTSQTEW